MKSIKSSILCLLVATGVDAMEINMHSKLSTTSQVQQLAQMLSSSQLDMKNFMYIKNNHQHRKSGDADEEYVQEEDDEEGEEEDEKVEIKPPTNSMTLIGRDKDGKFKHHDNYLKLKNKINEQEKGHQNMFDSINQKLNDETFLQQAMQSNSKGVDGEAKPATAPANAEKADPSVIPPNTETISKLSSKAPDGMTVVDEKCYEGRYGDLKGQTGRRHFQDVGSEQGRLRTCATNMTSYQTQRYLDEYPDLQHALGRHGRAANALARDHWLDHGFNEKRSDDIPEWDQFFSCGDTVSGGNTGAGESFSQTASCKCKGTIYMGLAKAPDTGNDLTASGELDKYEYFKKLRQWKTWERKSEGKQFVECTAIGMGVNPSELNDFKKGENDVGVQCWCEPEPAPIPSKCADYGGDCLCNGLVFQMVKDGENGPNNFFDAFDAPYTVNNANNTNSIKCSKKSFEGINAAPGKDKICFCDERQLQMPDETVQQVKAYWRAEKAKKEEEEAIITAKQKASEAKADAIAAEKKATADLKATIAANKEKKEELKREKEAATKKAEEDAKIALEVAQKLKEKQAAESQKRLAEAKKKREAAAKKKEDAEKRRAAALKEKREEEKQRLLDEIEKDKQEAVEEAVEAALEEQRAAHLAEVAELKRLEEEKRVEFELKKKMEILEEEAAAAEAARAAEEAREKELQADAVANAEHRAQAEQAAAAAHGKALAEEIAAMEAAYKKKLEAEEKKRKEVAAERARQQAEILAQREKAKKDAEAAKQAAADAEVAKKAELAAAEALLKKEEEEEHQKEMELEKEALRRAREEQDAKHKLLKAQKDAELTNSEAAKREAEAQAEAAKKELEEAKERKKAALEKKKGLKKDIEAQKEKVARLKAEETAANDRAKKSEDRMKRWQEKAKEAKADAAKKLAAAEKKLADHEQALKDELARIDAEHAQALKDQQKAFKDAADAQARAAAAAEAARKRREEEQVASHKRQLAARKAHFEGLHSATWSEATTGISMLQLNVEDKNRADDLIKELFYEYLVADIEELNLHMLVRTWIKDGKERIWFNQNQLTMITTDEKIPLIKATIDNFKLAEPDGVPYDLVVVPIATGGKAYIEWVHQQTSYVRERPPNSGVQAAPAADD